MSREEEIKNPRLFDVRIVDRNIRKGLTTRKAYDAHLKSLLDVSDKIAPPDTFAASDDLDIVDDEVDEDEDDADDVVVAAVGGAVVAGEDADDEDEDEDDEADDEDEDEDEDDEEDEPAPEGGEGPSA